MQKRQFTAEFKTRIVLEVLREEKQLNELAKEHDISPNQLRNWKKEFIENYRPISSSDDFFISIKIRPGLTPLKSVPTGQGPL